jgi:hypothetical protein
VVSQLQGSNGSSVFSACQHGPQIDDRELSRRRTRHTATDHFNGLYFAAPLALPPSGLTLCPRALVVVLLLLLLLLLLQLLLGVISLLRRGDCCASGASGSMAACICGVGSDDCSNLLHPRPQPRVAASAQPEQLPVRTTAHT